MRSRNSSRGGEESTEDEVYTWVHGGAWRCTGQREGRYIMEINECLGSSSSRTEHAFIALREAETALHAHQAIMHDNACAIIKASHHHSGE